MLASMEWPRLDTRSWNLSFGALATSMLAACGPFVVIPEGETDTDAVTDTDPQPTDPSAADTTPAQCVSASDCDPGYECIDGACVYGYYCNDGGCCYGGSGGCCYGGTGGCCYGDDCYNNGCYSDAECGFGGICDSAYGYGYGYNQCIYPGALPECGDLPEVMALELPLVGEGEFVSLSFVDVDVDPARDIVVGREGTAELHYGANAAPPVLLPVPVGASLVDATSGDFDSDGDMDIVASTLTGELLLIASDGAGGFELTQFDLFGVSLTDLHAVEWDGNDALDVAGVASDGQAMMILGDGSGELTTYVLPTEGGVSSLDRMTFSGDSYDDIVVQDQFSGQVYLGNFTGELSVFQYMSGSLHGRRRLLSARVDETSPDEIIGVTPLDGYVLLELWAGGVEGPQRFALSGDATVADTGDVDGDGSVDLVTAGIESISYVRASAESGYPGFTCVTTIPTAVPTVALEVGDFDGNGRADLAHAGYGGPIMVLLQ